MFAHFLTNKVPKQMAAFLGQMFTLYAQNFSHKTFLGKHYLWANRELFHTRTPIFSRVRIFPTFYFPTEKRSRLSPWIWGRCKTTLAKQSISSGGFPFACFTDTLEFDNSFLSLNVFFISRKYIQPLKGNEIYFKNPEKIWTWKVDQ